MKITEDNYYIQIPNFIKDKKILSFADIHYGKLQQLFYKGMMKRYFDALVQRNKDIDAVLIPGDLLFYLTRFKDEKFLSALISDLEDLVNKIGAPIYISYGNHDLPLNENQLTEEEKRELDLGNYLDNRRNGIYVLDNEQAIFNDIVITGFSPRRDAYAPSVMPSCLMRVKECFDRCNFQFSKGKIHILMSHENKFFTHPSVVSEYGSLYDALTIIIGGHLHDGGMPLWLQDLCKECMKDYGIWEKIPPKINMCRGLFKVSRDFVGDVILPSKNEETVVFLSDGECASIVNRGVAKYSWFLPSRPSCVKVHLSSLIYQSEEETYLASERDYCNYRKKEMVKK